MGKQFSNRFRVDEYKGCRLGLVWACGNVTFVLECVVCGGGRRAAGVRISVVCERACVGRGGVCGAGTRNRRWRRRSCGSVLSRCGGGCG